ncbi:MAG: hypothetical protein RML32_11735, partial [Gammaproteobacteria bacterium]|nr:hypothetical protein [Gammaproteobacteria bacterium]
SSRAYNNVIEFTAAAAGRPAVAGLLIVHGRYRDDPHDRQRFDVDFERVELRPGPGADLSALRQALGFAADAPLVHDLKPPRLHSHVIYLDETYRINTGSLGGLYVLKRSPETPVSI